MFRRLSVIVLKVQSVGFKWFWHYVFLTADWASSLQTVQTTPFSISDFHLVISVAKHISDSDITVISLEILKQKRQQ